MYAELQSRTRRFVLRARLDYVRTVYDTNYIRKRQQ